MNPKVSIALLTALSAFLSALVAAKIVPSAMTTMSWIDTLYSVGLGAVLTGLSTFLVTTVPAVQKTLRLRP